MRLSTCACGRCSCVGCCRWRRCMWPWSSQGLSSVEPQALPEGLRHAPPFLVVRPSTDKHVYHSRSCGAYRHGRAAGAEARWLQRTPMSGPLAATHSPSVATKGRQYSARTAVSATARATAAAYASRCSGAWPRSSARPQRGTTLVMPARADAAAMKLTRFCMESMHVTCMCCGSV